MKEIERKEHWRGQCGARITKGGAGRGREGREEEGEREEGEWREERNMK